ncbi:MAG: hypothetical protein EAZ51_06730 [Sphingobacteriales bacterium]|nr:MAG: hypothetical protein EAZ64_09210 [Sphingobacteriales bacterium]TAF80041.1 MAG: hypothetical protein EAZ51_06730 [Sphingobacteriales bacterium]
MMHKLLGVVLVCSVFTISCKKETRNLTQVQDEEIKSFLGNSVSNFTKDTSGIYYQILEQPTGDSLKNSDQIFYYQNLKTTEGVQIANSDRFNYVTNFLGYLTRPELGPIGYYKTIMALAKRGGKIRSIIPSYLAYGKDGSGSLIKGNAIIDATFEIFDAKNTSAAEDTIISRYIKTLNLNFTRDASGVYYSIISPGNGADVLITSTISANYIGKLFNGSQFDASASGIPLTSGFGTLIKGWQILTKIKKGGKMRILIPSYRAYGSNGRSNIPGNCPLDFEIEVVDVK